MVVIGLWMAMRYSIWLHSLSFKFIWVATVWLIAEHHHWLGTLVIWGYALVWWANSALRPYLALSAKALGAGFLCESIFCYSHIALDNTGAPLYFPPLWLLGLWVAFASLLPFGLASLQKRLWLACLTALIFAPMSYSAGSSWGAMNIRTDTIGMAVIGLLWGIAFTWLVKESGTKVVPIQQ